MATPTDDGASSCDDSIWRCASVDRAPHVGIGGVGYMDGHLDVTSTENASESSSVEVPSQVEKNGSSSLCLHDPVLLFFDFPLLVVLLLIILILLLILPFIPFLLC